LGAGPMPDVAREALNHLGVTVRSLSIDRGLWVSPYPHGNKIIACAALRPPGTHVFLDSDMVCVAPLDFAGQTPVCTVSLVPEGTPTGGRTGDGWARVYDHFGLAVPTERVRLVRRRRIEFLPYFNAGMVAFDSAVGVAGQNFGQLWLDTAQDIDRNLAVAKK